VVFVSPSRLSYRSLIRLESRLRFGVGCRFYCPRAHVTVIYVGCSFVSQWVAGLYSVLACLRESVLACDKNATRAPAIAARHQAAAWKAHSALRAFLGHDNTPTPTMARDGLEARKRAWRLRRRNGVRRHNSLKTPFKPRRHKRDARAPPSKGSAGSCGIHVQPRQITDVTSCLLCSVTVSMSREGK
jgi:hypothetical protein